MKKRTIAAIVCVAGIVGALAATAVAQSQRFPDVPPDHYASEAVEWAADVGVTTGYTDGTFKPEQPLSKRHAVVFMERYYDEILGADQSDDFTRGDMMVLLKAINDGTLRGETPQDAAPETAGAAQSQRFPDVPADHYAFEAVEWAAEVGVTTGYTDGTFKPQRPLSKRHAVVFMGRYYDEILGADQSDDFTRGDMMVLLKAINDGTLRDTDTGTGTGTDTFKAVAAGSGPHLRAAHRQHHHMLGRQPLRADRRARGHLQDHHRQHLRHPNRQHHHMLGRQPLRADRRARGHLQGRRHRHLPRLRDTNRKHHHMLGKQRLRASRRARGILQVCRHRRYRHVRDTNRQHHDHLLGIRLRIRGR